MITDDFLLDTPQARTLFHDYAEDMPIIDYHSHLDPQAVAENKQFDNIAQLWLDGDHYKWRAMRTNGIPEELCSGKSSDRAKYDAWAGIMPKLIRNPLYHWTHLELRRPFGITGKLFGPETAGAIWDETCTRLRSGTMGARDIVKMMNVEVLCTTDDPVDDLRHHRAHAESGDSLKLLPTFRPDKARNLMNTGAWLEWLAKLEALHGAPIRDLTTYKSALAARHAYFVENGCRLSDHAIDFVSEETLNEEAADKLFHSARDGQVIDSEDVKRFSSYLLSFFAELDAKADMARQLHIGALRNPNGHAMRTLGPDTGYDAINDAPYATAIARILDRDAQNGTLPRTILYNLNPCGNEVLAVMAGSFQDGIIPGKMQFGAAWWFLDQLDGMTKHIEALSQLGTLARFVGMLTDSRSFLSFTRHEYFRRILCRILGRDMRDGLIPDDLSLVAPIVQDICYNNAKAYFRF